MSYIANKNTVGTCVYGTWHFKEGEAVPLIMAVKFPQHVTEIKDPEPIVVVEEKEEQTIEVETKNEKRKGQQS